MADGAFQRVRGNSGGQGIRDDDQNEVTYEQPRNGQSATRWRATLLRKKRETPNEDMWARTGRQRETRYDMRHRRIYIVETHSSKILACKQNQRTGGSHRFLGKGGLPTIRKAKRTNGLEFQGREKPRTRLHRRSNSDGVGTKRRRSRPPAGGPPKKLLNNRKRKKSKIRERDALRGKRHGNAGARRKDPFVPHRGSGPGEQLRGDLRATGPRSPGHRTGGNSKRGNGEHNDEQLKLQRRPTRTTGANLPGYPAGQRGNRYLQQIGEQTQKMTNSEYEEHEMAQLIEIMSDSESYGGPESNPEDQEENPDEEGGPGEGTEYHHLKNG